MDWFSWLSMTHLESTLVSKYALAFAENELEEDDIRYFNHEFLKSIGISIAKHRIEILKIAMKEKKEISHPMSRLIVAIKRTKRYLFKGIRTMVAPKRSYRLGWKDINMLKRNKRVVIMGKEESFLLTDGSPLVGLSPSPWLNSISSPMIHPFHNSKRRNEVKDWYRPTSLEEIRWDTLFQDLNPT